MIVEEYKNSNGKFPKTLNFDGFQENYYFKWFKERGDGKYLISLYIR